MSSLQRPPPPPAPERTAASARRTPGRSLIGRLFRRDGPPAAAAERPRRRRVEIAPPFPVVYAVGDVHGAFAALGDAEARIRADGAREPGPKLLVHLGDYVDRGPQSAAVIDHLLKPLPPGYLRACLAGNHEVEFLRFLDDPEGCAGWLDQGGDATLASYGLDAERLVRLARSGRAAAVLADAVPAAHRRFLEGLPVSLRVGDHVFVHAGLRPGVPLAEQSEEDLLWIREPFLSEGPGQPLIVVHGHTPSLTPSVGPGRIGIDTGACVTGRLEVLKIVGGVARIL